MNRRQFLSMLSYVPVVLSLRLLPKVSAEEQYTTKLKSRDLGVNNHEIDDKELVLGTDNFVNFNTYYGKEFKYIYYADRTIKSSDPEVYEVIYRNIYKDVVLHLKESKLDSLTLLEAYKRNVRSKVVDQLRNRKLVLVNGDSLCVSYRTNIDLSNV